MPEARVGWCQSKWHMGGWRLAPRLLYRDFSTSQPQYFPRGGVFDAGLRTPYSPRHNSAQPAVQAMLGFEFSPSTGEAESLVRLSAAMPQWLKLWRCAARSCWLRTTRPSPLSKELRALSSVYFVVFGVGAIWLPMGTRASPRSLHIGVGLQLGLHLSYFMSLIGIVLHCISYLSALWGPVRASRGRGLEC